MFSLFSLSMVSYSLLKFYCICSVIFPCLLVVCRSYCCVILSVIYRQQKFIYHIMQVSMTLNISADLQSLFTWNTKQVCQLKNSYSCSLNTHTHSLTHSHTYVCICMYAHAGICESMHTCMYVCCHACIYIY